MNKTGSFSRSGFASSRTINVSSEMKSKLEVQNLRQLLQERMVEFSTLDSEWHTQETEYTNECETLVSQLRDLELQLESARNSEITKHLTTLAQVKQNHQLTILDLQEQIEEQLTTDNQDDVEELDQEIATLKEEIAKIDSAPPPTDDIELVDEDAEERLRVLEDRLDEKQQLHEEVMRQRDDDSRSATRMVEQLIAKNQEAERVHDEQIQELIETLNNLDKDQAEKTAELDSDMKDEKKQILNSMRSTTTKISAIQRNVSKKQKEYNSDIQVLHEQADQLRSMLEALTARQKQQMKEAVTVAKKFADEKKKFVAMHRELEMLNAELVRETVEHETLMKELNKMDSFVLSQMSAGPSTSRIGGSSTFSSFRSGRF